MCERVLCGCGGVPKKLENFAPAAGRSGDATTCAAALAPVLTAPAAAAARGVVVALPRAFIGDASSACELQRGCGCGDGVVAARAPDQRRRDGVSGTEGPRGDVGAPRTLGRGGRDGRGGRAGPAAAVLRSRSVLSVPASASSSSSSTIAVNPTWGGAADADTDGAVSVNSAADGVPRWCAAYAVRKAMRAGAAVRTDLSAVGAGGTIATSWEKTSAAAEETASSQFPVGRCVAHARTGAASAGGSAAAVQVAASIEAINSLRKAGSSDGNKRL